MKKRVDERGNLSGEFKHYQKEKIISILSKSENIRKTFPSYFPKRILIFQRSNRVRQIHLQCLPRRHHPRSHLVQQFLRCIHLHQ